MDNFDDSLRADLPVTENKDFFKSTMTFRDSSSHEILLKFDRIYKQRMKALIEFMSKVNNERYKYGISSENIKEFEDTKFSFLGTSELVISQLFYLMLKDELSEQTSNFPLDDLCRYIARNDETNIVNECDYRAIKSYAETIICLDFNAIYEGLLYDLFISMWSCFEASINSLTKAYENEVLAIKENSSIKGFKKIICDIFKDSSINHSSNIQVLCEKNKDNILKKYPIYVSFSDRVNYLYKYVLTEYPRDAKVDKDILLFAGAIRNTIHNNGIHLKESKRLLLHNVVFNLEKNKKLYLENLTSIMILVNEIFDIYCAILDSV